MYLLLFNGKTTTTAIGLKGPILTITTTAISTGLNVAHSMKAAAIIAVILLVGQHQTYKVVEGADNPL
jgi:hypothetical protein